MTTRFGVSCGEKTTLLKAFIEFTVYYGDVKTMISIINPLVVPKHQWMSFCKAVEGNGKACVSFFEETGTVNISTYKGETKFEVELKNWYGCGGITVSVPNHVCIYALRKASEAWD